MKKLLLVGFMVLTGCETMLPHYRMYDEAVYLRALYADMAGICANEGKIDMAKTKALYASTQELFAVAVVDESEIARAQRDNRVYVDLSYCPAIGNELDRMMAETQNLLAQAYAARTAPIYTPPQQTVIYTAAPQVTNPSGDVTFGLEEEGNSSVLLNTPDGNVLCSSTGTLINCR